MKSGVVSILRHPAKMNIARVNKNKICMKLDCPLFLACCFFTFKGFSQKYLHIVPVIDVVQQKLIPEQTIVLNVGIISKIGGTKKIKNPANVINGEGTFLMSGIAYTQMHFFRSGGLYTRSGAPDRKVFTESIESLLYKKWK